MKFAAIEPTLKDWAKKYGRHFITGTPHDSEVELRHVSVVDDSGYGYEAHINIEDSDQIGIGAYDMCKGKEGFIFRATASEEDLANALVQAYEAVEKSIQSYGRMRTIY